MSPCLDGKMIFYLVTRKHSYTLRLFLNFWAPDFLGRVTVLPYESLVFHKTLPAGTYIFSDIERLGVEEAVSLRAVFDRLAGAGYCVFNHPLRSLNRFGLLKMLHEKGINRFNVVRPGVEQAPVRFPVFVRRDSEHTGSLTPLLWTWAEVEAAAASISKKRGRPDDIIVVEFCDTSDGNGVFRKYAAYIVGERVIPIHIMFSRDWMVKGTQSVAQSRKEIMEEMAYIETNPHASALGDICRLAGIRYGRIDYAVVDGRIQVWEINTNPAVLPSGVSIPERGPAIGLFLSRIRDALEEIDTPACNAAQAVENPLVEGINNKRYFQRAWASFLDRCAFNEFPYAPYAMLRGKVQRLLRLV